MLKRLIRLIKENPLFVPFLFLIDLLLFATDLVACVGKRKVHPNKLCIIKLDKIGDYILLRNFLLELHHYEYFKGYEITIIGNIQNKLIVDFLDKDAFPKIIWVDIYKYATNIAYRYKLSRQIYQEGFDQTIVPTYSRVLVLDDFMAFVTRARIRICQSAHLINMKRWERSIGNHFYTTIHRLPDQILFEFERNRFFFQTITGDDFSTTRLQIQTKLLPNLYAGKYVVIIPGAADMFRQWSPTNFTKVADFLITEWNTDIILCGSPAERDTGLQIIGGSSHPEKINNAVGALSMPELFSTYYHASFIVTNETGAVHIGAALNKKMFTISNGNHFKKYTEYPATLDKEIHYIYPTEIDDLMPQTDQIAAMFDYKSNLDINSIHPGKVIECIKTYA